MERYEYFCERCEKNIILEKPIQDYKFKAHKCPNHELVFERIIKPNLFIDMDYIGKKLESFEENGVILARLEYKDKIYSLETNGDNKERYLEIVEYHIDEDGGYVENWFSEPIYDVPKDAEQVIETFNDWIE